MHLKVTIDGQLVGETETNAPGRLYVFHEYGRWSLVAVATTAEVR
jgi:predicted metal-dependent enzyme (double-stranded beta helix superfamily)